MKIIKENTTISPDRKLLKKYDKEEYQDLIEEYGDNFTTNENEFLEELKKENNNDM